MFTSWRLELYKSIHVPDSNFLGPGLSITSPTLFVRKTSVQVCESYISMGFSSTAFRGTVTRGQHWYTQYTPKVNSASEVYAYPSARCALLKSLLLYTQASTLLRESFLVFIKRFYEGYNRILYIKVWIYFNCFGVKHC